MRERTLLIQRAVSLGEEKDTKTTAHRTVRLLAPLREDLLVWKLRCGWPLGEVLIFPGPEGGPPRTPSVRLARARVSRVSRKTTGADAR